MDFENDKISLMAIGLDAVGCDCLNFRDLGEGRFKVEAITKKLSTGQFNGKYSLVVKLTDNSKSVRA